MVLFEDTSLFDIQWDRISCKERWFVNNECGDEDGWFDRLNVCVTEEQTEMNVLYSSFQIGRLIKHI